MSTTIAESSFHADNQFGKRIDSDVTLIPSCWYGGQRAEVENKDYVEARVYEGSLCRDCVLLAKDDVPCSLDGDLIITTVLPASRVTYEVVDE